ncbi:hypothetical protein Hanom_Chr15g01393461 [Helianthus anomalus]
MELQLWVFYVICRRTTSPPTRRLLLSPLFFTGCEEGQHPFCWSKSVSRH